MSTCTICGTAVSIPQSITIDIPTENCINVEPCSIHAIAKFVLLSELFPILQSHFRNLNFHRYVVVPWRRFVCPSNKVEEKLRVMCSNLPDSLEQITKLAQRCDKNYLNMNDAHKKNLASTECYCYATIQDLRNILFEETTLPSSILYCLQNFNLSAKGSLFHLKSPNAQNRAEWLKIGTGLDFE